MRLGCMVKDFLDQPIFCSIETSPGFAAEYRHLIKYFCIKHSLTLTAYKLFISKSFIIHNIHEKKAADFHYPES